MSRSRRTYLIIIDAVIFVLLEVAALSMLNHRGSLQHIWLSKASHAFMATVWGGSESIKRYVSLDRVNEELARENFELRERLSIYESAQGAQTADSLTHEAMTVTGISDFTFTPATIVKISRNRAHNYFIVNKGSEDGVRPQSGVITTSGVVGIIDAVDKHYSYGLAFLNSDISVSSRIGRDGPVGRMMWDGISSDRGVLKDIPLQNKFEPGDTVWTSGFSAIFPPDIPLGIIESSKIVGGAVYEISVGLSQNFRSLRYVTIVDNSGKDEMSFLEQLESEALDK